MESKSFKSRSKISNYKSKGIPHSEIKIQSEQEVTGLAGLLPQFP